MDQQIDRPTIIGMGLLLMPLLTMWHEIGGHAAICLAQGGRVATIGAFYVDCTRLDHFGNLLIAGAGVFVDTLLALVVYLLWRRVRGDMVRLLLWLIWVTKAFVAAGYFCFSGATGAGDLGPGIEGGIGPLSHPLLWRAGEFSFGAIAYLLLVRAAIRTLGAMLGDSRSTGPARRRIAHTFYATIGIAAVLTGLLNPLGIVITIMSAAASSFGGNAGFIPVGFAVPSGKIERPFKVPRSWPVIGTGGLVLLAFALLLGPSLRP